MDSNFIKKEEWTINPQSLNMILGNEKNINQMEEKMWKNPESNFLSGEEISVLREKFLVEYSKKKGWDDKKLTTEQMLEIVNQVGYKNPDMIKS